MALALTKALIPELIHTRTRGRFVVGLGGRMVLNRLFLGEGTQRMVQWVSQNVRMEFRALRWRPEEAVMVRLMLGLIGVRVS